MARQRKLRGYTLNLEHLEDRLVPTASGDFLFLQGKLKTYLDNAHGLVDTIVDASKAKLPIIDKSLGEITGADTVIAQFKDKIDLALNEIGQLSSGNLELQAENILDKYLGYGQDGVQIELKDAQGNVLIPEVTLATRSTEDLIDVKLHLGKVLSTPDYTLGLGLDGIPFKAHGTFNFSAGFQIATIEFGLDKDAGFFVKPMTLELTADANVIDPLIDAELGFLHVKLEKNPANPTGNHLHAGFGIQVDFNHLNDSMPVVSKPILNGGAHIDLMVTGGFTDAELTAPSVNSNFVLNWDFSNSQTEKTDHTFGSNLTVDFKDVKVNLGSYLTQMVGPAIQKIQQFTEPYKDFFKLLGDPIPVISDIAKVIGDNDGVSILDIAGLVGDSGEVPPEYAAIIKIAKAVIQITNVIDAIQLEKGNVIKDAFISLGNFNLIGNQGGNDVREVTSAIDSGFGNISKPDWSSLQKIAENINLDDIKGKINDVLGEDLGNKLGDALENLKKAASGNPNGNYANINLSFPLTDHPAQAIFGLLVGQDTDLVSFEANAHLNQAGEGFIFNYEGFEIKLIGGIDLDAHLRLAYDTFGLRSIVTNFINSNGASGESDTQNIGELLLDGLYLDPSTHLTMNGFIGVKAGINYTLFSAFITAKLDAGVNAYIPEGQDANGDGKVRVSEFTPNLFNVDGQLSGSLDLNVKLGIDPFSIPFDQHLADGEILGFHIGATNPFEPAPDVALATKDNNGKLTLNMGSQLNRDARHYKTDSHNESYIISHVDAQPGDPAGETVLVTAFGYTQKYKGVTSIVADGDDGNDSIVIDDKVTVPVTLKGGAGSDTITAAGTGVASIEGGDGDDTLTGGIGVCTIKGDAGNDLITAGTGNATLYGGGGNDKILGGAGTNSIFGEDGDDYLVGGTGLNTIFGGVGNDRLFGGIMSGDTLNGDAGNDTFTPGTGFTKMNGGIGNDQFLWRYLDPANNVDQTDGSLDIIGGEGNDSITLFGGPHADTFTVSKTVGDNQHEVQIKAPYQVEEGGFGYTSVLTGQMENIDIEAGEGADKITINELTNTRVVNVGVNLNDLVKSIYGIGDGVVDQIIVNGTNNADNVTLQAQDVQVQGPTTGKKNGVIGGVTTITGMPNYTVKLANVKDDVRFNALNGNDTVNVKGITGPTLVNGNGNLIPFGADDDIFNVSAFTLKDFSAELNIDANGGSNTLNVSEPGTFEDTYVFTQSRIESTLLKAVNYTATGGDFSKSVNLTTGLGDDQVSIKNTLLNVVSFIKTGKGDDTIIVGSIAPDLTGNLAGIVGTLSIDAGEGTNNQLTVSDAGTAKGNQNVLIESSKISGMAGPLDNTIINYLSTGGTLTLNVIGSNASVLNERYVLNNPGAKLVLDTQDGNDKIDISVMSKQVEVQAGAGNDQITVGYGFNKLDAITGPLKVSGGQGSDLMAVVDAQTASGKSYTIQSNSVTRTGAGLITFDSSLETTNVTTSNFIDEISAPTLPISKVNVAGNGGQDRLTGPNSNVVWYIQGQNAGTLGANLGFSGIEKLRGGTGNDRFALSNNGEVQGSIDGGTGNNVLDYSAYSTPVSVNLQTKVVTKVASYLNVKEFVGGSASDVFTAPDLANGWLIQSVNTGQVSNLAQGLFKFTGFENLRGGTAADGFQFTTLGQIDGTIDDKAGTDSLDYSSFSATMPIQVNLTNGTASRVRGLVSGIENVTGGAGDDIIVGNTAVNSLNGGDGRDILIGGLGADILQGGSGEDLLIGGTTAYDNDSKMVALNAVMKEWGSNDTYANRRQHLLGKLNGGKNGSYILSKTLVPEDAALDKLTGGTIETDWFWAAQNKITDLNAASGEKIADAV